MHPKILRLPEVLARVGVKKTKLHDMIKKGLFPPSRNLMDSRSVGWLEQEVDNYILNAHRVHPSASANAQVAEPGKESDISVRIRTPRASAKQTKGLISLREKVVVLDDALLATGMEIMGCPVFLHKKSNKVLLDIGSMSTQLIANLASATVAESE